MSRNTEPSKRASALSAIRDLTAAKVEAETQIAHCLRHSASEERMLRSLLAKPKNSANKQYLILGKKACRTGIKAWKLSIKAFRNDISRYESEISAILKRIHDAKSGNKSR